MVCPSCGGELRTKKSLSISLLDLFSVIVVGIFFVGVLVAIAHAMGPWKTVLGIVMAIVIASAAYHKELEKLGSSIFSANFYRPGVGILFPLFFIWALVRFFLRYEIRSYSKCSKCGYKNNENS